MGNSIGTKRVKDRFVLLFFSHFVFGPVHDIWAVAWAIWYMRRLRPACAYIFCSEPLLVAWIFYDCEATDWTRFGVSKLKRRLYRHVWWVIHMSKWHIVGNHMPRLKFLVLILYSHKHLHILTFPSGTRVLWSYHYGNFGFRHLFRC